MYDTHCDELARHFLDDEGAGHEKAVAELAQVIQDAIEGWLDIRDSRIANASSPSEQEKK